MPRTVTVISDSGDEVLPLADVKAHLRVLTTDEDSYISALIAAAVRYVEVQLGRTLATKTLRLTLDAVPASEVITLPYPPARSLVQVQYRQDDTLKSMSLTDLRLDSDSFPARVTLAANKQWPIIDEGPGVLRIDYLAGSVTAADIPASIKQAIKLMVGHWFEHREAVVTGTIATEIPLAAAALLESERVLELG